MWLECKMFWVVFPAWNELYQMKTVLYHPQGRVGRMALKLTRQCFVTLAFDLVWVHSTAATNPSNQWYQDCTVLISCYWLIIYFTRVELAVLATQSPDQNISLELYCKTTRSHSDLMDHRWFLMQARECELWSSGKKLYVLPLFFIVTACH